MSDDTRRGSSGSGRGRGDDRRGGRGRTGGNGAGRTGGSPRGGSGRGAGRGSDPRGSGGRRSGQPSSGGAPGRQARGRSERGGDERSGTTSRRRDLKGAAASLPNWVVEELARVTPPARVAEALEQLGEASAAFTAGRYRAALKRAVRAKELAPRDATVREVLGLAAYRSGDWDHGLRELRAYRRMTGDTTHLPVEMDLLRALGRPSAVADAWRELGTRGGSAAVLKEGKVVYGSHLIDEGRVQEAWDLVHPERLNPRPFEEDLRLWYVAARAAALLGEVDTAKRLRNAILEHDPGLPGIDELESIIARAGR